MNYGLIYNPDVYPSSPVTNSDALFNTLGYFWKRVFTDRNAVKALTLGQTDSAAQAYQYLLDAIDSYSNKTIPILEKRNWYPITVYRSSFVNNALVFGEGVKFGDTVSGDPYIFGRTIPAGEDIYSLVVPKELVYTSVIADQIITPGYTWINGKDFEMRNGRLYFYLNPFTHVNSDSIINVKNSDGTQATFTDYRTGSPVVTNEQMIVLWCYTAELDSDNLNDSLGYLFGLNVPHNETGKSILANIFSLYVDGPTVNDIKAVALSTLGLPIVTRSGTIASVTLDGGYNVITTDNAVYRYPAVYPVKSSTIPTAVLKAGDVPVNVVELMDNVVKTEWWTNELGLDVTLPTGGSKITLDPTTGESVSAPGLIPLDLALPSSLITVFHKHALVFKNGGEVITLDDNDNLVFPVHGDPIDVAAFQDAVNTDEMKQVVNDYLGTPLNPSAIINPVDFIFKAFMKSTTAMLRVKFLNTKQLASFYDYFAAVKAALPPQILLIILCDVELPVEVFSVNTELDDSAKYLHKALLKIDDSAGAREHVMFNSGSGTGMLIKDMEPSRFIRPGLSTETIPSISLVIS